MYCGLFVRKRNIKFLYIPSSILLNNSILKSYVSENIFSKGLAHRLDEEKRKNLKSAQVEDDNFKNSF